ncbi:MAG: MerR family transcriptional regulator [Thermoleophilia bacterium]|nr:MerR family transcriptional regulator [Gaiellaceae bacterium]MDW8339475.1 MerR family transcriptional regulator [Thermoleophilia bacterium]
MPPRMTIGEASRRTGWSPRMLRYLERRGLVVPERTRSGYRGYGIRELNQLETLRALRARFGVELAELEFALRLRREPELRAAVETWLEGTTVPSPERPSPAWVEWEQRKQERLLATPEAA